MFAQHIRGNGAGEGGEHAGGKPRDRATAPRHADEGQIAGWLPVVVSLWSPRKQEGTGGQARGHTQWDSWGHRGCALQGQGEGGGVRARPSVSTEVADLRKVLTWGLLLPWPGPFHPTLPCPQPRWHRCTTILCYGSFISPGTEEEAIPSQGTQSRQQRAVALRGSRRRS